MKTEVVYGGKPIQDDIDMLSKSKPQILVGTPGRIHGLVRDKYISLKSLKYFILDE